MAEPLPNLHMADVLSDDPNWLLTKPIFHLGCPGPAALLGHDLRLLHAGCTLCSVTLRPGMETLSFLLPRSLAWES